jgi:hypothetical protein
MGNLCIRALANPIPEPDSTQPNPGSSGAILTSDVTASSLMLNWDKGTDDITTEDSLRYYVYSSETNNINTVAECEANGTLLNNNGTLNITTFKVSGLAVGTTYYFNVVIQDKAWNKTVYQTTQQTTSRTIDTIAPIPGNAGTLSTSGVSPNSLTLSWTEAQDDVTDPDSLKYYVYSSLIKNINSVAGCEAKGSLLNDTEVLNITSFNVTKLEPDTTYYFNVIVQDAAGNKAAYISLQDTTKPEKTDEYSEVQTSSSDGGGCNIASIWGLVSFVFILPLLYFRKN